MKTTKEVIQILESHGITDDRAMIDVLEDGEALLAMGITLSDYAAVESAHALCSICSA